MKKTTYSSLLLCLTSSLLIGNSFSSNLEVLDGPEISNRIRSSLQGKTSNNLTQEDISKSKIPPAEYFVRCAIEMILESLRQQEMLKNKAVVSPQTTLNAGQEMFAWGIGAFAHNVTTSNPTTEIKKTALQKKNDLVPPLKTTPVLNPEKTEQDKNQTEANRMAAKRKKEEELQKLKNEANQKVQQESERFSLKQKKQFREQKEQIQREEDERVRLAQEEANRKAAEDLAKQQKQPEQQKQEEKNDGLCPHKVPKNSEYQCARCINANNPHPVLIPNNVLKLNENPKESLKKATTKETTYNKDDYKKEKTPGELIEEIKAMPKNNDAEKDSVKEAINNAKKKIADYYAIQESDDNMTKQKKNISKRSKIEQLRKLDPDYESDDEEE